MKKVLAVNGSPRKGWSTDRLLQAALEGAAAGGAETRMVYLYDLKFTGCKSCMVCKLKGGKSLGRCVIKDELKPILDEAHTADAIILGSPIYWHEVSGMTRCFFERFLFQYNNYDDYDKPLSPAKKTAMLYAMNMPESMIEGRGYLGKFKEYEELMRHFFGHCETLYAAETLQVRDYDKYHLALIDGKARMERHETVFPRECRRAYELGARLVAA